MNLAQRSTVSLLAAVGILLATSLAPTDAAVKKSTADPATAGYAHVEELDFHPKPDNRTADGKKYPVLRSVEPCVDGYMPRVFARYSTTKPVLVCW